MSDFRTTALSNANAVDNDGFTITVISHRQNKSRATSNYNTHGKIYSEAK